MRRAPFARSGARSLAFQRCLRAFWVRSWLWFFSPAVGLQPFCHAYLSFFSFQSFTFWDVSGFVGGMRHAIWKGLCLLSTVHVDGFGVTFHEPRKEVSNCTSICHEIRLCAWSSWSEMRLGSSGAERMCVSLSVVRGPGT